MAQTCTRCSRPNPDEAVYCYFDGSLLQGRAAGAAVNPSTRPFPGSFVFPSGRGCGNFDQLALACQEEWSAARDLLGQGFLERFLGGLGRADLAGTARSAADFPDRDRGLDQLLAALPSQVLKPPKLAVEPQTLSLGVLRPSGKDQQFELHLRNQGMRLLYGSVASGCEWLTLGDAPGQPQKMFQFGDEGVVHVHVRAEHLRAGNKPLEGRLTIESNGGGIEVQVKAEVPVTPFAEGVLTGATTPREIAVKAKQAPKEAAELFEKGLVARWYKVNGWTYPVAGESASGLAAVQQFFEALGLVKPPKVEIASQEVNLQVKAGERVEHVLQVLTREKRPLYAHAVSNQPWLSVSSNYANSSTARIKLIATVPPQAPEVLEARVTVTSNGNQRFVVPVKLSVSGGLSRAREVLPAVVLEEAVEVLPAVAGVPQRAAVLAQPADEVLVLAEAAPTDALTAARPTPPPLPAAAFAFEAAPPAGSARLAGPTGGAASRAAPVVPAPLKLLLHTVPALLLLLFLFILMIRDVFAPARTAEEQPRTQVTIEGGDDKNQGGAAAAPPIPVDPAPYLFYRYSGMKQVGISVANTGKLLTFSPIGATNLTVLKVGDFTAPVGGPFGRWTHQENAPELVAFQPAKLTHSKNVWLHQSDIQVTQVVNLVPSDLPVEVAPGVQKRLLDTCLIAYQIENRGRQAKNVGLRVEVDTLIGSNDGVPFAVPGMPGLVNTFADFRVPDPRFPDFVQALEVPNLQNPGTVAHMTLKVPGLEPPGRVSLTHWTGGNPTWDIPVVPMLRDSAVILYWYDKVMQPGEKRSVGFAYGLGSVASDKEGQGKLGLTLSGNFEPGEVFTVSAYVSNPVKGQTLTLQLPAGLQRVDGEERQPVPPVAGGKGNSLVTWRVRVQQPGQFPVLVQSSTGVSQRRVLTITRPDPAKRPSNPDNIFR